MTNPNTKDHFVETNNPTREQEDFALEKTGLLKITFASVILKGILLSLLLFCHSLCSNSYKINIQHNVTS